MQFFSMDDMNEMCAYAISLYKLEEYRIGEEIQGLHVDDLKQLKLEAHEKYKILFSAHAH